LNQKLNKSNNVLNQIEGARIGYQSAEMIDTTSQIGEGYCVAWSLFYLDSRLSAPNNTPQEIYISIFIKFNSDPTNFLKFIRGYAKFLGEFYNKIYEDFISKKPEFKYLKEAIYQGQDKEREKIANEIVFKLKADEYDKYQQMKDEFDGYIDEMLISSSCKECSDCKECKEAQKKTDEQPEMDFIEYMQMASQFRALPYEELLKLKLKVKNSEKVSEKNREIIMMLVEDIISEKKPKKLKVKKEKKMKN
jgi:hypothetical protein